MVARIEQLGHELAYIEGLRERFESITSLPPKIDRLSKFYGNQTTTWDELNRVRVLLQDAIMDVETVFDIVDAQTCEIITVLRGFDLHVRHVREARDDLHRRFMDWGDIVDPWQSEAGAEKSDEVEQLIRRTYRLLAQKFPQTQDWAMVNRG